jgi:hypothetical protein
MYKRLPVSLPEWLPIILPKTLDRDCAAPNRRGDRETAHAQSTTSSPVTVFRKWTDRLLRGDAGAAPQAEPPDSRRTALLLGRFLLGRFLGDS